ncbi:class I SAM-dependent DNA methyltransferase [Psychrobacter phenylpyruvicus]|uniref:Tellurite resistance protein TehB n=1 Tax=Psychrobacter phenylpyruvicus TaxID=29432 RepID=A0A379LHX6_9GAMM|nr:class I SAM-dependent methyltransferase [Psychrobacter phenylpyruvicus]SUD90061.1 tellurite resistance protein TehB [Psychrobacter phenylpyruvicus]
MKHKTNPTNGSLPTSSPTDSDCHSYSESYFDALYQDNTDPWQYQTRWYERRKRDMCLAVLPQAEYGRAIELGCGNGVFSELLAQRCQSLLSIDGNKQAVQLAQQRLADLPHVRVIQGVIPEVLLTIDNEPISDNPLALKAPFDLIVISEILYYLAADDIDTVIAWIEQNLATGGTVLCCHWRYDIEGFELNGEKVHQRLYQAFNQIKQANTHALTFTHQSKVVDSDFLLDIWQKSSNTVAMSENLV